MKHTIDYSKMLPHIDFTTAAVAVLYVAASLVVMILVMRCYYLLRDIVADPQISEPLIERPKKRRRSRRRRR